MKAIRMKSGRSLMRLPNQTLIDVGTYGQVL
jgi:hypothetical protein